jgi:hypothetical protein
MPPRTLLKCHRCARSFSSLSGLTRHQTYSGKCIIDDIRIVHDSKPVIGIPPFGFAENSKPDSIALEHRLDAECSVMTTAPIVESAARYFDNRANDNIQENSEYDQEDPDIVVLPTDEVDQRGGHIYVVSSHRDSNISNHKENIYHPWTNEHEFWLTDWLIMKAKVSNEAANEILRYIHRENGSIKEIQIRNVHDIKKRLAMVSTYTLVRNFQYQDTFFIRILRLYKL